MRREIFTTNSYEFETWNLLSIVLRMSQKQLENILLLRKNVNANVNNELVAIEQKLYIGLKIEAGV